MPRLLAGSPGGTLGSNLLRSVTYTPDTRPASLIVVPPAVADAGSGSVNGSQATETDTATAGAAQATVAGVQATELETAAAGQSVLRIVGAQVIETGLAVAGVVRLVK